LKFCIAIVISAVVLAGFYFLSSGISGPAVSGSVVANTSGAENTANLDSFAKCLTQSGAKMYGAYWCGHCQNQKSLFGSFFQYVDYVECDSKGPNANPDACAAAGITGYPTWIINGQSYPGEQSIEKLSSLTGCSA
jgi:hypothetical protein